MTSKIKNIPENIKNIKVAVTDLDGVLRGKYLNRAKYESSVKKGMSFCDVVFGWDSADELYEKDSFTGWRSGFQDSIATLDESTMRSLPTEDNESVLVLGDFAGGKAEHVCPRALLKRVLKKADDMGYTVSSATEFEFFMFEETPHSVREKNYKNLKNMTPGMFGYSILRSSTHSDFYHDLLEMCDEMEMPVECIHTETGAGVLEVALEHCDALAMADKAVLFKTFTKVLAQKQGLMACFMAKWSKDYPGQSGHLHMSLQSKKDGKPAFYDESKEDSISDTMRYFIGGQQKLMPELLAMVASTNNSYTRLIPGFWAPTDATWGVDNRTCALRAISASPHAQRVEYRVSAADINPYLAMAASIASGLWGVENKIEPNAPITGNAYAQEHAEELALPTTLLEASQRLKNSTVARELFGDEFVEHYAYTRQWEFEQERRAITDWQLERYFEII